MKNSVVTKGIVLSEMAFKENSKILNILTEDYGLIGVIAKGSKTLKSKLRAISNKMIYAEFSLVYKKDGLSTLTEGSIINSFKNIYNNYEMAMYAYYIMNLSLQTLKENNDKNIFYLLRDSLIKINDGINISLITNMFELQLLSFLGVSLNMDCCSLCGSDKIYNLSIKDGGLICEECYHEGYLFNSKTIGLIKMLLKTKIGSIKNIEITDEKIIKELSLFIDEYYSTYTGLYLMDKKNFKKYNIG